MENGELVSEDGAPIRTFERDPLLKGEDAAETMAKIEAFILSVSKLFPPSPLLLVPSPLAPPLLLLLLPLTPPIYNKKWGNVRSQSKMDGIKFYKCSYFWDIEGEKFSKEANLGK